VTLFRDRSRPLAKVCGLTRAADVEAAIAAGADLLGFVQYERSPRHLSDLQVVALAGAVRERGALSVLVIVDGERSAVDALARDAGLDAVQLCGGERPDDWRDTPYAVLRRLGVDGDAGAEIDRWEGVAAAFVLDHPSAPGGTGRAVDLARAAELALRAPCLLAGGLDADALAAADLPPHLLGFDASSGLESEPGRKCPDALRRYVQAAHAAAFTPTSDAR
jgi:phosphoribosylanthranilate isomerase